MRIRIGVLALVAFAAALAASAQLPGLPATSPTPAPGAAAADPLGRDTPRGTFLGFLQAAQDGTATRAAEYLQLPPTASKKASEDAVRDLKYALDERFLGRVNAISRLPEGALDDGLPALLEKVGTFGEEGEEGTDVLLIREIPKSGPPVWVFAADTLRDASKLYRSIAHPDLDSHLPGFLRVRIRALPLWGVLLFLLGLPSLYALGWLFVTGLFWLLRLVFRSRAPQIEAWTKALRRPLAFLLLVVLHRVLVLTVGLPLLGRYRYERIFWSLIAVGLCWLAFRVVEMLGRRRERSRFGDISSYAVISLGRRLMQFAAVTLTLFIVLQIYDVNLTAWLAGIGVGGIALAFAAQKSLENVFAGFTVLGGQIVRPGDTCKIGPYQGEIEDVSLYATRLRTQDRTLVHIPNGQLAVEKIENLSRRDKFWFHPILGLRYETTAEQMETVLTELRGLLAADPRVEPDSARVRFLRFGAYSLDIELFAYLRVSTWLDFLAAQEELNLRIMGLIEKSGTDIAFPSSTSYVARDRALGAWEAPPSLAPPPPSSKE